MSSNNYLSNKDPRLPTRVQKALAELVAGIELEAAVVARGVRPRGALAQHLSRLVRIVEAERPEQAKAVVQRMGAAVDLVGRAPRFKPYRDISLASSDVLGRVDLVQFHKPVLTEIARTWVHIPPEVSGAHVLDAGADGRMPLEDIVVPQSPYRGLRFHLARVKCLDETGSGWLGEVGEDEIYCGAVAVDESGDTSSGGLFHVRDFDDGDVRDYGYPGKSLQYFSLGEGSGFPKIYTVALSMIEHDSGDLAKWFEGLLELVRKRVTEYLTALALGVAAGTIFGPLGSLIGAAIGWAIGRVISVVKSWLGDEHLGTRLLTATINSHSGNWVDSGGAVSLPYTRDFKAHGGHYRVWWRCELVR